MTTPYSFMSPEFADVCQQVSDRPNMRLLTFSGICGVSGRTPRKPVTAHTSPAAKNDICSGIEQVDASILEGISINVNTEQNHDWILVDGETRSMRS